MPAVSTLDAPRQVLVNLGNRYVVFGPSLGLPQPLRFDREIDSEVLPRVADESEIAGARIADTLRVSGMTRSSEVDTQKADVELIDDEGNRVLIDINVRERDPKQRDLMQGHERLREAASIGQTLEVWYFNIERLKLTIMHRKEEKFQIDELTPIDVWEKTAEGVFNRARVVEEVEDWVCRVAVLYEQVRTWLVDRPGLRCEEGRTVTMSEEMMQQFAVTEREISVLDVLNEDQVIASFVPRGLWLIGAWGRVDIITRDRTRMLLALRAEEKLEWRLVSPEGRHRTEPFDKTALLALLNSP